MAVNGQRAVKHRMATKAWWEMNDKVYNGSDKPYTMTLLHLQVLQPPSVFQSTKQADLWLLCA